MELRRAKIVCTVGPASRSRLGELIAAGMDVARLNFSHGNHDEYAEIVADIRRHATDQGRTVAILQDLQGPKIRTGKHVDGPLQLAMGQTFTLTSVEVFGTAQKVSTTYEPLARDVAPGDEILLSDGLLRLVVQKGAGRRGGVRGSQWWRLARAGGDQLARRRFECVTDDCKGLCGSSLWHRAGGRLCGTVVCATG